MFNLFHWWLAYNDRPKEHREQVDRLLDAMAYAYDPARQQDPDYDPDAPSWWLGDEEAARSTMVLGARLGR